MLLPLIAAAWSAGLDAAELYNSADTLDKGSVTIHPIFPSQWGVTDSLELRSGLLLLLGGPNGGVKYHLPTDGPHSFALDVSGSAGWLGSSYGATGAAYYTFETAAGDRINASAGGGFGAVLGVQYFTVPVTLGYDLVLSENSVLAFQAAANVRATALTVRGTYNHAWINFRLGIGLTAFIGAIPETGVPEIDEVTSRIPVIPLPYLALWWRLPLASSADDAGRQRSV